MGIATARLPLRVFSQFLSLSETTAIEFPPDAVVGAPVPPGLRAFELEGDSTSWQKRVADGPTLKSLRPAHSNKNPRFVRGARVKFVLTINH